MYIYMTFFSSTIHGIKCLNCWAFSWNKNPNDWIHWGEGIEEWLHTFVISQSETRVFISFKCAINGITGCISSSPCHSSSLFTWIVRSVVLTFRSMRIASLIVFSSSLAVSSFIKIDFLTGRNVLLFQSLAVLNVDWSGECSLIPSIRKDGHEESRFNRKGKFVKRIILLLTCHFYGMLHLP